MKLDIFSDIHFDSWYKIYRLAAEAEEKKKPKSSEILEEYIRVSKTSDADVVVFAGDAGNGFAWYQFIVDTLKKHYKHVISTPGNHCFYNGQGDFKANWVQEETIEGVKFFACPLWTNFRRKDSWGPLIQNLISDFKTITHLAEAQPDGWKIMRDECYRYMDLILAAKADIVVTHFPPIIQSIAPQYEGNVMNPYFCNDEDKWFKEVNARVWIHGHTHSPFDYRHHNTRVVSQPVGYAFENWADLFHAPFKTIEV